VSIPQPKVYIETIKQIQMIIETDTLEPGDKIPSERELSERLSVGRSSVREALRALELLGLIETRRGEGTFVKGFEGHHLVELIGSFILQNEKAKKDLLDTKKIIEEQGLILGCEKITDEAIEQLKELLVEQEENYQEEFLKTIILSSGNRLLLKIWLLLAQYAVASQAKAKGTNIEVYEKLIVSLEQRDVEGTLHLYQTLNG
jgi:GntR family transcriptional repressor for pyruvate dehydrogenase complex